MESPQLHDPPDINKVTLRFLGSDPKGSDAALFQNSLVTQQNGVTTSGGGGGGGGSLGGRMKSCSVGQNVSSKSPEEFEKGVPGDIKVPGGMIGALLEDQNKNRLKSSIGSTYPFPPPPTSSCNNMNLSNGNQNLSEGGIVSFSHPASSNSKSLSSSSSAPVRGNELGDEKSKSGSGRRDISAANSKGNHVEIDVDMTLPQTEEEDSEARTTSAASSPNSQKDGGADASRKNSRSNEIICNGQKTNSSGGIISISGGNGNGNGIGGGSSGNNDCAVIVNMNGPNSAPMVPTSSSSISSSSSNRNGEPTIQFKNGKKEEHLQSSHETELPNHHQPGSPSHFPPSCEKDLEILKNVRKVYVQLTDDNTPCYYKVSDESEECLFETALGDTNGSIWSRYFKQQQKVILVHDRNQRGVLKLEFGRSRTISCCQTLRFAAMTASFKLKPEEPLCIIFKDKECCVSCCCCPEATYETVPQLDSILPFSVFTKGRWKNRAELMVKHNDGSILGFIDKEQNSYSLTMGENLKPAMKACLIGFLIAMDVMDRQDSAGKFSCYLRPTTILLIILLLMLCITIGGYLLHHFSSMFLYVKGDSVLCGTFDEAGSRRSTVPHFNNNRTSDPTITSSSSAQLFNNSSSHSELLHSNSDIPSNNGSLSSSSSNSFYSWPL